MYFLFNSGVFSSMTSQKKEVIWNMINAGLAGSLVLMGSLSTGELTTQGIAAAFIAAFVVIITKFKNYWDGEKGEYASKIFNFM